MQETIVTILAIIGLYTVLKKLGCITFIVSLILVLGLVYFLYF